jgi:hypothetical protein
MPQNGLKTNVLQNSKAAVPVAENDRFTYNAFIMIQNGSPPYRRRELLIQLTSVERLGSFVGATT